jgi:hypothetical protein
MSVPGQECRHRSPLLRWHNPNIRRAISVPGWYNIYTMEFEFDPAMPRFFGMILISLRFRRQRLESGDLLSSAGSLENTGQQSLPIGVTESGSSRCAGLVRRR